MPIHNGGCHCGAVRFKITAPDTVTVHACNCSVCTMSGFVHLIVPARDFDLETPMDAVGTYTFNTHTAQHYFCKICGIKSFYVPRSNPDGFSININCVDQSTFTHITYEDLDGQNWEDNAGKLAHLSD